MVEAEVHAAIEAWRPRYRDAAAAVFAREVVRAARPPSVARARTLLWSCSRLAAFGRAVGLDPVREVLLHPSVIERFVTTALGSAPMARRRTVRSNLRFVARRVVPHLVAPAPRGLARSRAKTPYTRAEIDGLLRLADAQPTEARRQRLGAVVCLAAGAGLTGADLRHVRGTDVGHRHGAMVVVVTGGRAPRVVPVITAYRQRLGAAAAFAAAGFITGGSSPSRHNITSGLAADVTAGTTVAPLDLGRLRASWLTIHARALGLPALFAAAGFRWSQQLGDLVATLPTPEETEMIRLLGTAP